MKVKNWFKGYILASVVILIGILLLVNIFLIYQNGIIIERNKNLQEEAERIKVNTIDITRNLHLADMAVRSYALVNKYRFFYTVDSAATESIQIFKRLEKPLLRQKFPMEEFYDLRDSVKSYYNIIIAMRKQIINHQMDSFLIMLNNDPGYPVWLAHQQFSSHVTVFENDISQDARHKYSTALRNSYLLQVILFLITLPTLAYSAYYAGRALKISEQLRKSEEVNNEILSRQNVRLEEMVKERTQDVLAQNEEIISQHEEMLLTNEQLVLQQEEIEKQRNVLADQNSKLINANKIIEDQNDIIHQKNAELIQEVERQTQDLKTTNLELIEQNNRLEQFAYIISHNLRSPLARIKGLSDIFEYAKNQDEIADIIKMMASSTRDLDHVIKDLAYILEIQKLNTQVLSAINLTDVVAKTIRVLKQEIEETKTKVNIDFNNETIIMSLPQYVESIFYNLLSNAIKYRHTKRTPEITISTRKSDNYLVIDITDNGLGIDLEKYKEKLFSLYKRFHFHVEGKGMGLYLVKTQIGALGGKIEVTSQVNTGSRFSIFFKM
jgi:signal transduction histidine kinase